MFKKLSQAIILFVVPCILLFSCAPTNLKDGDVELQGEALLDGKPLPNDSIQFVFSNNKISKKVCTDVTGTYRVKIPAGTYSLKYIISNEGGLVTSSDYGKVKYGSIYSNTINDIPKKVFKSGKYKIKPIYAYTIFGTLKPQNSAVVSDSNISFIWNRYLDMQEYELYIRSNDSVIFNSGIVRDTTYVSPISLKKGNIKYTWYIIAYNDVKDIVAFSEENTFLY